MRLSSTERSSLTYFYDMLLHGQFGVKNESKVPGRIREVDVARAKSNRIKEGNGGRFQGRRKGKEKSCFVVQFELIFGHPCLYVVCACTEFDHNIANHNIANRGEVTYDLIILQAKFLIYTCAL